jgi:hypothetical protein
MQYKTRISKSLMIAIGVCLASCIWVFPSFGGEPKAGDMIDASNVDQYADYLPFYMQRYIKDGWGVRPKPVVIHVRDHEPNLPPKKYQEVTDKNKGKTQLNADGTISGWEGGLPFPDPQEPNLAYKIIWNANYHWRSDSLFYPDYYVTSSQRKGAKVAYGEGDNRYVFWKGRTSVDPKPNIPDNPKNLFFTQILSLLSPPTKGMKILTWRYDYKRDDEMWTFVPTLRRTLRMVSSERQNPVNGLAITWDDFYGFEGKIDQYVPSLVGERKILYLCHQQTFALGEYKNGCQYPMLDGPDDPWELLEMYEVDVKHKNPRSPESRKKLWITKEAYHIPHTQIYDKQGELWKATEWADSKQPTLDGDTGPFQTEYSITDFKTGWWNGALLRHVTMNADLSRSYFTPATFEQDF